VSDARKENDDMVPDTAPERPHRRRAARAAAVAAALLVASPLIAACGGGGNSPGVANLKSTTTSSSTSSSKSESSAPPAAGGGGANAGVGGSSLNTSSGGGSGHIVSGFAIAGGNRQTALKLAACMRANGEPNFPDPNAQGVIQGSSSQGLDPRSPQFQAAMKKCQKYTPNGGKPPSPQQLAQAQQRALAFSACMRSHGIKDFPDPNFSGGGIRIQLNGGPNSDVNPSSPLFQHAQQACASLLPGRAGGLVGGGKQTSSGGA
jgi:hypothetical protein